MFYNDQLNIVLMQSTSDICGSFVATPAMGGPVIHIRELARFERLSQMQP